MNFKDRIRTCPQVFDAAAAEQASKLFAGSDQTFSELAAATASNSPFLASLLEREKAWIIEALSVSPEATAKAVIDAIEGESFTALSDSLRQAKRRIALLVALADLGGVWSLSEVTAQLTALADAGVQKSIDYLVAAEMARGKLPHIDAKNAGLFVLAMGKMGAFELNYSSDIDLIVLFDETLYPPEDYMEIRKTLIRVTQRMVKLLSEQTAQGYVFRTDLRLRPNPSATPVCIGMGSAERYYESEGRTWERAAFIKARPCAGDIEIGRRFLHDLQPFIWRRHLDFAAIQDAHDMRLRIREHKGLGGPLVLEGHDVKLGRGGIREIEFFTQTRQLICGGRDPSLRASGTLEGLAALTQMGWVASETRDIFIKAYTEHRALEHRLQMVNDQQTQMMPESDEGLARIAAFMGYKSVDRFKSDLTDRFTQVHALTESFFAPGQDSSKSENLLWDKFSDPTGTKNRVEAWNNFPALRSPRARQIFARILPRLITQLQDAISPVEALVQFERFLQGLPAGVQVFSMFESNERLLELLVDICASAPNLAAYLGQNSGVLDAVLSTEFFQPLPSLEYLVKELEATLAKLEDYETKLDTARRWAKEYHFRIGVQLLRQIQDSDTTARAYSDLAEASLQVLLPVVATEFTKRHGPTPGQGAAVIGMGKLGSREMTASSDLDLIVVYDAEGELQSEGKRPLAVPVYYARLTQSLVAALTAPTAEGAVYEVDMRLRPSGRQGPVAVSLVSFANYQREEAWTWEHLALTRARAVAGPDALKMQIEQAIRSALDLPRDVAKIITDAGRMRARLLDAKPVSSVFEVKSGPGRMQDCELVLQTGMLLQGKTEHLSPRSAIADLIKNGWLSVPDAKVFDECLKHCFELQQIGRVADGDGFSPKRAGIGLEKLVLAVTGHENLQSLKERLAELFAQSSAIANRLIPLVEGSEA